MNTVQKLSCLFAIGLTCSLAHATPTAKQPCPQTQAEQLMAASAQQTRQELAEEVRHDISMEWVLAPIPAKAGLTARSKAPATNDNDA